MSRQYNMYNVQLSEFWKQRCDKETMHNSPNFSFEDEGAYSDLVSEAPSRVTSQMSVASTATRNRVRSRPRTPPPNPAPCRRSLTLPAPDPPRAALSARRLADLRARAEAGGGASVRRPCPTPRPLLGLCAPSSLLSALAPDRADRT